MNHNYSLLSSCTYVLVTIVRVRIVNVTSEVTLETVKGIVSSGKTDSTLLCVLNFVGEIPMKHVIFYFVQFYFAGLKPFYRQSLAFA